MPYIIPDKPWSEEFAYFLVAVPNDRGFIRAAKGTFTDLGSQYVWGAEGLEDDSADAAQRWLEAIAETWRLIEMGWPDQVLGYIDELEDLLRQGSEIVTCCGGDNVTVQSPYNTGIDESSDPVPTTVQTNYSATTWDDAHTNYICPALSQFWKLQDSNLLDPLGDMLDYGLVALSFVVNVYIGVFSIGAAVVLGGISMGTWLALLSALKDAGSSIALGDYSDLDTHADDFVCAVIAADGPDAKAAAADAFIDGLSYNAITKTILKTAMTPTLFSNIYEGKNSKGEELILADNSGGCPTCLGATTFDHEYIWYDAADNGEPFWTFGGQYTTTDCFPIRLTADLAPNNGVAGYNYYTLGDIMNDAGYTPPASYTAKIQWVEVDFEAGSTFVSNGYEYELRITDPSNNTQIFNAGSLTAGKNEILFQPEQDIKITGNSIALYATDPSGTGNTPTCAHKGKPGRVKVGVLITEL